MACTTCGSTKSCGCNCNTGQSCTPCAPSVPQPYYSCNSPCPEDHTKKIIIQQFYTTVKVDNSWNIPACGETAVISVSGLKSIEIGGYLWSSEYGYFEVTAFDAATSEVTIKNNCNEGNAAAGTNVAACSEFIVTALPCDCGDTSDVCVAIDFTAPDVDTCIDITLTSTEGLTAGDTVQIGTGFYFLQEIKPNNIINICNKGEGITPGTPVIAKDANDNYQYCLSTISVNICAKDTVTEGVNIVCDAEGPSPAPLAGSAEGYVLTLVDPDLETAAYRPLGVTACAKLTAALSIVNGTLQYNNVAVDDSSLFQNGDIIRINNRTDRGEINGIPDATHINFFLVPLPSANATIPVDTLICAIDCCEDLQNQIDELSDTLIINLDSGDVGTTTGSFVGNDTVLSAVQSYTLNNTSSKTMHVTVTTELNYVATIEDTGGAQAIIELRLLTNVGAPPVGAVATHTEDIYCGGTDSDMVRTMNHTQTFTIAPSTSTTFQFQGRAAFIDLIPGITMPTYEFSMNMSYLGVAV